MTPRRFCKKALGATRLFVLLHFLLFSYDGFVGAHPLSSGSVTGATPPPTPELSAHTEKGLGNDDGSAVSNVSDSPTSQLTTRDASEDANGTYASNIVSGDVLTADKNGKYVVKIGHIGAVGALPNEDKILNISRMQLIEEGILGPDLDFEITSRVGCGESFEGVAVAAAMYHVEQIRAFIGPYCNTELEAVAKMSSFWNIPVISYMSTATTLADRTIYKTLARISSKNTNSIAKATIKLVQHYNWQRVPSSDLVG
ncbi:CRE-GCY-18 protein [Aphelenchoides avenae]|nr:CRE-GCY-18 protein [Aphelenchus avenae]